MDRKSKIMLYPKVARWSMIVFALLLFVVGFRAYELYGYIFKPNVTKNYTLYITANDDLETITAQLEKDEVFAEMKAFKWIAKKKEYAKNIKPGKYLLQKNKTTNEVVNMLRIGNQVPVKVTFNNARTFEDLAGKVSIFFQSDSIAFLQAFKNSTLRETTGFSSFEYPAMFIPNTYEMFWTNTPEDFIKRMKKEYDKFWNDKKLEKASTLKLSPIEISTLASIVQEESVKAEEQPIIAGLYLNRLSKKMLLQADPTIKFTIGDFTVRRITNAMLETDSPYNTYKYRGLPPGPINFPEISSINAVLNFKQHQYLYMCAKEDFSGYHNFAKTLTQHNINAEKYRKALNRNRIYR